MEKSVLEEMAATEARTRAIHTQPRQPDKLPDTHHMGAGCPVMGKTAPFGALTGGIRHWGSQKAAGSVHFQRVSLETVTFPEQKSHGNRGFAGFEEVPCPAQATQPIGDQ